MRLNQIIQKGNFMKTSMINISKSICYGLSLAITLIMTACGGSQSVGTGVGNTGTVVQQTQGNAAAAAASVFGNGLGGSNLVISSQLLNKYVEVALQESEESQISCEDDVNCTCVEDFSSEGPQQVTTTGFADEGTYGSSSDPLTVTADDFCTQPDGEANTGNGADGAGLVAAFEISDAVNGACQDEEGDTFTVSMLSGSSGIYRETNDYHPQIWGQFLFEVEDEGQIQVDCTIFLGENEEVLSASCTDESGEVVSQDDASTCEFSTTDSE